MRFVNSVGVIILFLLAGMPASVTAVESLSVTMHLNERLDDVLATNPELASKSTTKKKSSGILTIKGPLDFEFRYAPQKSLSYPDVKLVIYPLENEKTTYIHIFPQTVNMTNPQMESFISKIAMELVDTGWQKQEPVLNSHDKALQDTGLRDYARYWLELDTPFNGIKKYEIVLTTFVDASVNCGPDTVSPVSATDCKNRFVRIGFYSINS